MLVIQNIGPIEPVAFDRTRCLTAITGEKFNREFLYTNWNGSMDVLSVFGVI